MMEDSFASVFKSEQLADAELVLFCSASELQSPPSKRQRLDPAAATTPNLDASATEEAASAAADRMILARFPAHRVILYRCSFFKAQIERWRATDSNSSNSKPQLELTIDSPDQQAAAEAVIAVLYLGKDALPQLDTLQLLQAVIIADRLQVTAALEQGVELLLTAARKQPGLPAATLDALASLTAWPSSLLPLLSMAVETWDKSQQVAAAAAAAATNSSSREAAKQQMQRVLVSVLGRLNDVWADEQLKQILLHLPLAGMQLLLSSDQLTVDSEDTVLYTAREYIEAQQDPAARKAIARALTDVVRCGWLSNACLSRLVLAADTLSLVKPHKDALRRLLGLRLATGATMDDDEVHEYLLRDYPETAASWLLPRRQQPPQVGKACVVWHVAVEDLKQACLLAFTTNTFKLLQGPSTPPHAGLAWLLEIDVEPSPEGCKVGVYINAERPVPDAYDRITCSVTCSTQHLDCNDDSMMVHGSTGHGWPDYFEVGEMPGGWDEAAWAAQELPTSGEVELKLTVHSVQGDGLPYTAPDSE